MIRIESRRAPSQNQALPRRFPRALQAGVRRHTESCRNSRSSSPSSHGGPAQHSSSSPLRPRPRPGRKGDPLDLSREEQEEQAAAQREAMISAPARQEIERIMQATVRQYEALRQQQGGQPFTPEERQAVLRDLKRHIYGQGGEQPNAQTDE